MDDNNKPIKLEGENALALWSQGREAWNQWVSEHPEADVSFRGVDFSKERSDDKPGIDFSGYIFPKGDVRFACASFGDGDVLFSDATFCDGEVSFYGTTFGNGNVSFTGASFGNGGVWFADATFGDGNVSFHNTTFGDREVSFRNATFGDGAVHFSCATFGEANVIFESAHFKGHVSFWSLENAGLIKSFTFRHAIFEKSLDLSENAFNCVVDLTNTKMANQVSLDGLQCKLNRTWYGKAEDDRDSERLRRLKEIAENNKDHTQAMIFHADEMRAKRLRKATFFKTPGLCLDFFFDLFSHYGQSIGLPLVMLLLITGAFGYLYYAKATELGHEVTTSEVILYSASNMLPFIPNSREARVKGFKEVFGGAEPRPYGLHGWILLQGALSFIFLFLLGLGLRNRFRI